VILPELEVSSEVEHTLCTEASHHLAFSRSLREQ
jgi:hypothetical protein